MNHIKFQCYGTEYSINDVGEPMNRRFMKLYETYHIESDFDSAFKKDAMEFLDEHTDDFQVHNKFFENFSPRWTMLMRDGRYRRAEDLWRNVWKIADTWEKNKGSNKRLHKGTLYYFWAVTCISAGNIEKGFLLMHKAMKEDKATLEKNNNEVYQKPAYLFVTLDDDPRQFLKGKVDEIVEYIEKHIGDYQKTRNGNLTLQNFRSRFLKNRALEDVVFFFTFTCIRIVSLSQASKLKLTASAFGSLTLLNALFGLCLVVDKVLKNKNPNSTEKYLGGHLEFLAKKKKCNLVFQNIKDINTNIGPGLKNKQEIQKILNSQRQLENQQEYQSLLEQDCAITWNCRNMGAHELTNKQVIYENFENLVQRIFNVLFLSVEHIL